MKNYVGVGPRAYPNDVLVYPKMNLKNTGEMMQKIWKEIPQFYVGIKIDAFIIMPNHVHVI